MTAKSKMFKKMQRKDFLAVVIRRWERSSKVPLAIPIQRPALRTGPQANFFQILQDQMP